MTTEQNPGLDIVHDQGQIIVRGHIIDEAVSKHRRDLDSPATAGHVTLLSKEEYERLQRPSIPRLPLDNLLVFGRAASPAGDEKWLVVIWNQGDQYRKSQGLPRTDFYIQLTPRGQGTLDKGIMSIEGGRTRILDIFRQLSETEMDSVLASRRSPLHRDLAVEMLQTFPQSFKAYIRLADECVAEMPKIAMLAYAQALRYNPALHDYIRKRLLRMRDSVLWGPVLTPAEETQLDSIGTLRHLLVRPWTEDMMTICRDVLWTAPTETRVRPTYLGQKLPRFFTWLIPHRLAAMSTPTCEADVDLLMAMEVTTVLTLTREEPLKESWFAWKDIVNLYVPIVNLEAPTLEEMDLIYDRFVKDSDGSWLVHCGGGKGRAGSVAACLVAMHDADGGAADVTGLPRMDSATAVSTMRAMRPGSIESERQERFIKSWISHRWAIGSATEDPIETITELESTIDVKEYPQGVSHENVEVCFLIGNPGSGKSWLAQSIAKRRSKKTMVISQDDTRSRRSCEEALGRRQDRGNLVILDLCNPDAQTRKEWLSLIASDKRPIAIYFDYDAETCLVRINSRLDHAVIRAGQGALALKQMASKMQKPTLSEGFGAILSISSFHAASQAVHLLGGPVEILKFPRTPHLLDLGAATSDDLIVEENTPDLTGHLTIEEKVDGANMGISLKWKGDFMVQNRSHRIEASDHAQFKPLTTWMEKNASALRKLLAKDAQYPERYLLYGEWVVAQHSIPYSQLPDRFLAFDLYDRYERKFLSRRLLSRALRGTGIQQVPLIAEMDRLAREDMMELLERNSVFYDGRIEGIYVRIEDIDRCETVRRGKVVRGDFIAGNLHWSKAALRYNGIVDEFHAS